MRRNIELGYAPLPTSARGYVIGCIDDSDLRRVLIADGERAQRTTFARANCPTFARATRPISRANCPTFARELPKFLRHFIDTSFAYLAFQHRACASQRYILRSQPFPASRTAERSGGFPSLRRQLASARTLRQHPKLDEAATLRKRFPRRWCLICALELLRLAKASTAIPTNTLRRTNALRRTNTLREEDA